MRRVAAVLTLALTLLLAGCFASQKPMFPQSSAVPVLGDGGTYATYERVDGKDQQTESITVRKRSDGGYDFINNKGATNPVSFHPISGGLHVAQVKLDGDSGYGYVLFRFNGNEGLVVPAECDKQDQEKMKALGVEIRSRFECRIDRIADPAAFFAALKLSEPISKMVRQ
jgi:hypothetical protein